MIRQKAQYCEENYKNGRADWTGLLTLLCNVRGITRVHLSAKAELALDGRPSDTKQELRSCWRTTDTRQELRSCRQTVTRSTSTPIN
jgi:hypothetical protein